MSAGEALQGKPVDKDAKREVKTVAKPLYAPEIEPVTIGRLLPELACGLLQDLDCTPTNAVDFVRVVRSKVPACNHATY